MANTLDSISDGYEEDDEADEEEKRACQAASPRSPGAGAANGRPGSPVADANSLQTKVAFLSRRATLAALHRHEVCGWGLEVGYVHVHVGFGLWLGL